MSSSPPPEKARPPDNDVESTSKTPPEPSSKPSNSPKTFFHQFHHKSTIVLNPFSKPELSKAIPLISKGSNPTTEIQNWIDKRFHHRHQPDGSRAVTPPRVSFLGLFSYSTPKERYLMFLGLFMAIISGSSMPMWLILLAASLDKFNSIGQTMRLLGAEAALEMLRSQFIKLVAGFAVVGGVSMISGLAYIWIWSYVGEMQSARIRRHYVGAVFRQDAAWFDARNPSELPTKIGNSMVTISDALGRRVADLFANGWSAFGCLAVSMYLDSVLALIMLAIVPVVALAVAVISVFVRRASRLGGEKFAAAGGLAVDVISGIKTVASLGCERWALDKYESLTRGAQDASVHAGFLISLSSGISGFLFYVIFCVSFIFGTEQVAANANADKDTKELLYCLGLLPRYTDPDCGISGSEVMASIYGMVLSATFFGLLSPGLNAINLGRQAAVDIFDTIDREPSIDATSTTRGEKLSNQALENASLIFKNVTFSYPTRPQNIIFYKLNLTVTAGSSVALVGPSGSGKSTISKLLLRLYDPNEGNILVGDDNVTLPSLNTVGWRDRIGYVAQHAVLFPGTIRENIALGCPSASLDDVIGAAKACCAHEFIMEMPQGYDTFYSGASVQLSGGQMQRISLARAILKKPCLLLLDEATSALDTKSEREVMKAIANIRETKKITTISIAHRLSTIMDSDKICVIANGSIAEEGTHNELLHQAGIYAQLCSSQGITLTSEERPAIMEEGMNGGDSVELSMTTEVMTVMSADTAQGFVDDGIPTVPIQTELLNQRYTYASKRHLATSIVTQQEPTTPLLPDNPEQNNRQWDNLSRLWNMNSADKFYLFSGTIGAILVGMLPAVEGIFTAHIVTSFYTSGAAEMRATNRTYSLAFIGLAFASLIGHVAFGYCFSVSGYRLTRRVRVAAFERIVRHSAGWFDEPAHGTGELISMLEDSAEAVSRLTGYSLGYRIQVIATLVAGITVSLIFAWQIGLLALGCVPVIVGSAIVQSVFGGEKGEEEIEPEEEEKESSQSKTKKGSKSAVTKDKEKTTDHFVPPATILETGLKGITTVQAYNLQTSIYDKYVTSLSPGEKNISKQGAIAGVVYGLSQFAVFGTFAILMYVGARLMAQGKVGFTEFFTSILAIMFGALGMSQVNADFNDREVGLVAAEQLFNLLDDPLDDKDPFSTKGVKPPANDLKGDVNFDKITFAYPTRPDHPVYYPTPEKQNGFELHIAPKQSVAFVGKSGCGKSTALQLFLRFYDASTGLITLDHTDVRDYNISYLRSHIGYVGQNPTLLGGTVKENILLGQPTATQDDIVKACTDANAHEFISNLAEGYDTDVTNADVLSGGQKQRIAIARAIISQPKILILDEATSALDNESERVVQTALDEVRAKQPRTTLIVAHRLNTVKGCDLICVLENGGVKESGTHQELMESKGLYHELWMQQVGTEE